MEEGESAKARESDSKRVLKRQGARLGVKSSGWIEIHGPDLVLSWRATVLVV